MIVHKKRPHRTVEPFLLVRNAVSADVELDTLGQG